MVANINGKIEISFSEAIDQKAGGKVSLSDGTNKIDLSGGKWSKDSTVYTVSYSGLTYRTKYTVQIADYKTESDKVLSEDSSHTFTTRSEPGTYSVIGTVQDDATPPSLVEDATVKIMQGNIQFGDTVMTNEDGEFTVAGVSNGTYNIVITKGNQIVTLCIAVSGKDYKAGGVTLPKGNTNSRLNVIGTDTPNVVEDGLHDLFNDENIYTKDNQDAVKNNGATVEIRLAVQKDDSSDGRNTVVAQMSSDGYISGIVLDLEIEKTVKNNSGGVTEQSAITSLNNLLMLHIPLSETLQGKKNYVVYRTHDYGGTIGTRVDKITSTANADGEYIEVSNDKTFLTLHAKFFSTYAIGYSKSSGGNTGGHSSGHSSTSQSYTIAATAGEGGSISPSGKVNVVKGKDKTFTFTPKEEHMISDVLIDGKSVGAVDSYTFTKVDAEHTIKVVFEKAKELPYYLDGDKKVFIGFASDTSGTMKYIAPEGETVLFTPNPKNYTDLSGHWAKSYIDFVTQRELFVGTGTDTFSPNSGMTRAMFVTVIGRLYERSYGTISETGDTFSDIPDGRYYNTYVRWAEKNGIILGVGENRFAPDREINREEMAAILYRFAEFLKVSGEASDTTLSYPDSAQIHTWANDAVKYCQKNAIISGRTNGSFAPQDTATRAEVATILQRFVEMTVL